jgi:hypothetical protein
MACSRGVTATALPCCWGLVDESRWVRSKPRRERRLGSRSARSPHRSRRGSAGREGEPRVAPAPARRSPAAARVALRLRVAPPVAATETYRRRRLPGARIRFYAGGAPSEDATLPGLPEPGRRLPFVLDGKAGRHTSNTAQIVLGTTAGRSAGDIHPDCAPRNRAARPSARPWWPRIEGGGVPAPSMTVRRGRHVWIADEAGAWLEAANPERPWHRCWPSRDRVDRPARKPLTWRCSYGALGAAPVPDPEATPPCVGCCAKPVRASGGIAGRHSPEGVRLHPIEAAP